jgi:hypothetical protein
MKKKSFFFDIFSPPFSCPKDCGHLEKKKLIFNLKAYIYLYAKPGQTGMKSWLPYTARKRVTKLGSCCADVFAETHPQSRLEKRQRNKISILSLVCGL